MKTLAYIMLFSLSACATAAMAAESRQAGTVTASGSGEIFAEPDRASVNLAVEAENHKLGPARAQVKKTAQAVLGVTDDLRIPRRRINTTGIRIYPEYHTDKKSHRQELTGYRVSRQIKVQLHELDKLGRLLQRAEKAGVNRVSPPQLHSSQAHALKRKALANAAKDARAKAKAMASALGETLGAVRSIASSQVASRPPRPLAMMRTASANAKSGAMEIGQIKTSAQVTVQFDLAEE
jgi:uncharacterized protein YggE